jgi:hypothetical protein
MVQCLIWQPLAKLLFAFSSWITTVLLLKDDLFKELSWPLRKGIVFRIDEVDMNLKNILTNTLIGASLSKLKQNKSKVVVTAAMKFMKKWKGIGEMSNMKRS